MVTIRCSRAAFLPRRGRQLVAETLGMRILRPYLAISRPHGPRFPATRAAELVRGNGGGRSLAVPERDQRGIHRRQRQVKLAP